jgi:hypothetical protein
MSLYDPYDSGEQGKGNFFSHAGFRVGFIAGIIMVCIHVFLLFLNNWTNGGDPLAWVMAWFVYFFAGRTAAQQHYDAHRDEYNPTRGVRGAGVGAAMVTAIFVWVFIIVSGVFRDAVGVTAFIEPITLYCLTVIDVMVAMGLGSWAGNMVVKKYSNSIDI